MSTPLKPGYKKTEVGMIPEDWSVEPVGQLAIFKSGEGISVSSLQRKSSDFPVPVFGGNGIAGYTSTPLIRGKSVVVGRVGQKCGEVLVTDGPAWITDNALYPKHILRSLDIEYFALALKAAGLNDLKNRNDLPLVTQSILHAVQIAWPPNLSEQRAIAGAMRDIDSTLTDQIQLIAKKREVKKGAMQELVSGKKRLPGFSGEWRTRQLGGVIAHCSSGATPYRGRPEYYKGSVKWITSGELNYNLISDTNEHISEQAVVNTNLTIHPVGTFLMAITGLEAAGTRGACGIVGSTATTNQSCMAIYPSPELSTEYLYHYYVHRGNELALRFCQGTKQQSYTAKLVKLLPIDLPPSVEEQNAIAAILSDMDAELSLLEQRLDKTRATKEGMMQELLTGRIRLV